MSRELLFYLFIFFTNTNFHILRHFLVQKVWGEMQQESYWCIREALVLFNTWLVYLDTVFCFSFLCRSFSLSLPFCVGSEPGFGCITATSRPPAPPSGLSSPPLADPMLSRLCRAVSPRLRAAPGLPVWVCACVLGQRGNGRVRSGRLSALPSLGEWEDRLALQLSDWRTRKTPYWGNHMPWYTTRTYTHISYWDQHIPWYVHTPSHPQL